MYVIDSDLNFAAVPSYLYGMPEQNSLSSSTSLRSKLLLKYYNLDQLLTSWFWQCEQNGDKCVSLSSSEN